MTTRPPYSGPVEALNLVNACVRLDVSVDWFRKNYDGLSFLVGNEPRYPAKEIAAFMDRQCGRVEMSSKSAIGGLKSVG